MLSIIVAIAENNAIGYQGDLIYHISADMRRFKTLTTGHTILMGRKTFESLPKGALPDRRNIVLTRNSTKEFPGAERFSSIDEALEHCENDELIYVIGGSEIYRQALPLADELELTVVHDTPVNADTYFPTLNMDEWEEIAKETFPTTEKTPYSYSFITLRRRC